MSGRCFGAFGVKNKFVFFALYGVLAVLFFLACSEKDASASKQEGDAVSVLVFIPGMLAGSPPYEMMAQGAQEFAAENAGVNVRVYEGNFNQAQWEEQLMSMVAEGGFDLVLTTNPALPEIAASVGSAFPSQKFVITDAQFSGNPQIMTYMFNQYEQALFLGYLAGLVTTSDMPHANPEKRIGFVAAQEYPLLTKHIVPGFLDGARRVDPEIELDFRVIGNWFDAGSAADLTLGMINNGVDVVSAIAGGAEQGIVQAIKDKGAYAVFFNTGKYDDAPGLIVGSGIMRQKELTKEILGDFLAGNVEFGTSKTVGVKEGYVDFDLDDPGFRDHVPGDIQQRFTAFMDDFRSGRIDFTVPPL